MRWVFLGIGAVALLTVLALGPRGRINPRRPLMLVPDMDFQPRYGPQEESRYFGDRRTMRTPPAGTVAFGGAGFSGVQGSHQVGTNYGGYFNDAGSPRQNPDLLRADDAFYRGKRGGELVARNPLPVDLDLLRRGRNRFNVHCAVCHGATGSGNGITTQYGLNVPGYHDDRLRGVPDGHIFDVITNGKGSMMPYGHQVKPADRWAIVAYVRALQRSQHATLAEVPEALREGLAR